METNLGTLLVKNFINYSSSSYAVANFDYYPELVKSPSYMTTLDFEQSFQYDQWRIWMERNWKLPVYISILYVSGIFLGQKWMTERRPYKLETSLKVWNFLLAAFSLMGFLRSVPEVLHLFNRSDGFYQVSCSR